MIKKAFWGPVKYQPQLFHTAFAGPWQRYLVFLQIHVKVLAGNCGGTRLSPCLLRSFCQGSLCLCSDFSISCLHFGILLPSGLRWWAKKLVGRRHLFICFETFRPFWISRRHDRSLWGRVGPENPTLSVFHLATTFSWEAEEASFQTALHGEVWPPCGFFKY